MRLPALRNPGADWCNRRRADRGNHGRADRRDNRDDNCGDNHANNHANNHGNNCADNR